MDFAQFSQTYQQRIESQLQQFLPQITQAPVKLHQAMHYAVKNGGKRIRPLLVYATGIAFAIDPTKLDVAACAVEFIHAYSLIHDDLPAMDDSDLRRGKPACHKAFGEATAILAGDSLQSLAFEILANPQNADLLDKNRIEMIAVLARACGTQGMAGGQELDLSMLSSPPSLPLLEKIHSMKTGALLTACAEMAVLAGNRADLRTRELLRTFTHFLGLSFQIQDDILDVVGDPTLLGKPQGGDITNGKYTWTALAGLEQAQQDCHEAVQKAHEILDNLLEHPSLLHQLTDFVIQRQY